MQRHVEPEDPLRRDAEGLPEAIRNDHRVIEAISVEK